jgi:hypothetical protein
MNLWLPANILIILPPLLGNNAVTQRQLGSLQVSISKTYAFLGLRLPMLVDKGLRRAVQQRM